MICHKCRHLLGGTKHYNNGTVSAQNTAVPHHKAHVNMHDRNPLKPSANYRTTKCKFKNFYA